MEGFVKSDGWAKALALFPQTDIYFTQAYHELNSGEGMEARCFLYQEDDEAFCLPFVESRIPGTTLADFSTCYGYSGPLSTSSESGFLGRAWTALKQSCARRGIVAGFIRFHPLLMNHRFADENAVQLRLDRRTVVIDLTKDSAQLWNSKLHPDHYWLRRARREGARFEIDHSWNSYSRFIELYRATMDRHHAAKEYRFSDLYFNNLRTKLADRGVIAGVYVGEKLISGAIILLHQPFAHYHLGGSDEEYRPLCPNALLFIEAALHLKAKGYERFHLGGGSDARDDNSLLFFKQRLSTDLLEYYTGAFVIDREKYDELCRRWDECASADAVARYGRYTLKYRYGN